MAATLKIPTIFTAVDKFSTIMRTMTKSVRSWSNKSIASVRRFDQKISKTFSKLSSFAQIGLGLGIGLIFREGLIAITDFETGLVGVGKTTGIANKELKTLGFDILKLSKNLKTVSAVKLLEFAEAAGQMGINSSKDILSFSSTLAQLEKTTDIIGAEGAQNIARLLEVVGEGPEVVDRFGSAIVALGNSSKATESQILSMSTRVAQSTSDFGLSSTEVLGLSTTLVQLGFKAEAAGTVMGKVFRRIELATIKGGKELKNFAKIMKLTPKQVQKAFKASPKKAFDLLIKGFGEIKKEGGSVQKAMLSIGLVGDRLSAVIPLLAGKFELLAEKTKLAKRAFLENMALQREFAESQKTITSALDTVRNSFNRLLTEEALQGSKLEKIQKALFFVADNMDKIIMAVVLLVAAFITMKIISGIMTAISVAQSIWSAITVAATAIQTAFAIAVNSTIFPIILIIAAIVAIILIIKNWSKIIDWIGKKFPKTMAFISKAWGKVVNFFKEFDFKSFFKSIGQSILTFLLLPMKGLLTLLSKIPGKIGKIAKIGLDKIGEVTGNISVGDGDNNPALDSPEISASKSTIESIQKNNIMLEIRDKGNNVEKVESKGDINIDIRLTPTQGAT